MGPILHPEDIMREFYLVLKRKSLNAASNRKPEAGHPGARTPFDCCSLSFQPFTHPVCARNADGTGNIFDLVNIIAWLKYIIPFLSYP